MKFLVIRFWLSVENRKKKVQKILLSFPHLFSFPKLNSNN